MTTRTQQLANKIQEIYIANKTAIDALPTAGPRGGRNAATIHGWLNYGNGTITKAANKTDMPVLKWWSGSMPTPSNALPLCVHVEILKAYNDIFC